MKKIKQSKGITLVALVITVIVLLILAGVAINSMKDTNLIGKSEKATEEYKKKAATEIINLKITNIQISNYVEKQKMPTLQELADGLCDDNEMEYVLTTSKNIASLGKLDKIVVGEASSIFAKLKAYPYEFEINGSLQLASIDGVKVADTNNNNNDNSTTVSKEEYNALLQRIEKLENNETSGAGEIYITKFSNVEVTANTHNTLTSITLPAGRYVLVGRAHYRGDDLRYFISLGATTMSAYDNKGYVSMNASTITWSDKEFTCDFSLYPSKSVTIDEGWIRAIRISDDGQIIEQ